MDIRESDILSYPTKINGTFGEVNWTMSPMSTVIKGKLLLSSYQQLWVVQYGEIAGDLLLGLKFVKPEILSTSFIDFLHDKLGELRSRCLGLKGLRHNTGVTQQPSGVDNT